MGWNQSGSPAPGWANQSSPNRGTPEPKPPVWGMVQQEKELDVYFFPLQNNGTRDQAMAQPGVIGHAGCWLLQCYCNSLLVKKKKASEEASRDCVETVSYRQISWHRYCGYQWLFFERGGVFPPPCGSFKKKGKTVKNSLVCLFFLSLCVCFLLSSFVLNDVLNRSDYPHSNFVGKSFHG